MRVCVCLSPSRCACVCECILTDVFALNSCVCVCAPPGPQARGVDEGGQGGPVGPVQTHGEPVAPHYVQGPHRALLRHAEGGCREDHPALGNRGEVCHLSPGGVMPVCTTRWCREGGNDTLYVTDCGGRPHTPTRVPYPSRMSHMLGPAQETNSNTNGRLNQRVEHSALCHQIFKHTGNNDKITPQRTPQHQRV